MVVVCLSVCNGCTLTKGKVAGENFLHEKLVMCKISAIWCEENIFKLGVEWRGIEKCVFFNGKLAISRKRWENWPRLLITNRKWHMPFQMKWKSSTLNDLEGPWQPVRSVSGFYPHKSGVEIRRKFPLSFSHKFLHTFGLKPPPFSGFLFRV